MFRGLATRAVKNAQLSRALSTGSALRSLEVSSTVQTVSSVPAGTVLKGCNVRVKGTDPVALEDSEYPEWLWKVLDKKAAMEKLEQSPEMRAKKTRKAASRAAIKERNNMQKLRG